jgi:hypothetical protein
MKIQLSQSDHNTKIKIDALDLEPIVFKLTLEEKEGGEGWDLKTADKLILDYRLFLFLSYLNRKYNLNTAIVPNESIDTIWHHHILDTEKYDEDCQELFGFKIHHFPYLGMRGEEDKIQLEQQFAKTLELVNLVKIQLNSSY